VTLMKEKLYKILENGMSCHGGDLVWDLPNGKPGKWHEISGDIVICENGIHLTNRPSAWFTWNCEIYEAEYEGEIRWDRNSYKCVVGKARLLKKIEPPQWWTLTHQFVERDIPSVNWLKPDLKPRKEWKLFKGTTWDVARNAASNVAWDAARNAARNVAWDAARNVAWDAARNVAWDAARNAVGDAARNAASNAAGDATWDVVGNAVGNAVGDAPWDAVGDASLMVYRIITEDLKIDKKYVKHINKRWEVWEKGYALLCDVNGVLYVYAKED
jgi:hypothetical protein